jgi:hypothetical protein
MEKISNINSYAEEKNPTHSAAISLLQSIQPPTSKQLATNKPSRQIFAITINSDPELIQ